MAKGQRRKPLLQGHYWVTVAFVLLALCSGLFIAGLGRALNLVGRAFALVAMLRLAGAFALVPAFLSIAELFGSSPAALLSGLRLVFWILAAVMALTICVSSVIFSVGGARLHPPDLCASVERGEEALDSPSVTSGSGG